MSNSSCAGCESLGRQIARVEQAYLALNERLAAAHQRKEYYLSQWRNTVEMLYDRQKQLEQKTATSAWAVEGRNELLEEYRRDNAALNRQVEEYRSVAFGLWESLEKARSSEPPVLVSVPSEGLFPGSWVEVR